MTHEQQPTPAPGEALVSPETGEHEPTLRPKIYVASLSDYNAGRLHGEWIDANQPAEDLTAAVAKMLSRSPEPGAEEYAIHDYDQFGPTRLDEYTSLETVSRLAQGLIEQGPAFGHWASYVDNDPDELDRFEETYRGHWPSLSDYASDLLDDLCVTREIEQAIPAWLQGYMTIDLQALGRDLALDGYVAEDDQGVWVFEG